MEEVPGQDVARKRIAEEVKALRRERGLTQRQLAAKANTSRSVIARVEQAATLPTLKTLYGIAKALGADITLGLVDPESPAKQPSGVRAEPGGGLIKVLVADAQRLFAESLATGLAQYPDFHVQFVRPKTLLTTGLDAAHAAVRVKPDVALVDFWMAEMAGPALTRMILAWVPGIKVLVTSWFHGPRDIQAALNAGARGFLPKSLDLDEVAEAVRRANRGDKLAYEQQARDLSEAIEERELEAKKVWERIGRLTPREVDVIRMLATGRSAREVAKTLGIALGTLRIHVNRIINKLEAESRVQAVAVARNAGLIDV